MSEDPCLREVRHLPIDVFHMRVPLDARRVRQYDACRALPLLRRPSARSHDWEDGRVNRSKTFSRL